VSAGVADASRGGRVLAVVAALAASWIVFDLLVWGFGESPRAMFGELLEGTWGTAYGAGQVLFKATPLVFTGLAVDMALRAGLFNIGAEGQLAVASVAVGGLAAALPAGASPAWLFVLVAVAAAAGALWALPAVWLKLSFGAHEVIATIMLNRMADALVALILGMGLAVPGTVRTRDAPAGARVPRLDAFFPAFSGSAANFTLVFAILLGALVFWMYGRTRVRSGRRA
jgi:simple sugar transport system permease protein